MLLNYIKLSLRLLARNPFFTGINIVGLAIGFASFYMLWEYSSSELKSDQYHKDFERIGKIGHVRRWNPQGGIPGSAAGGIVPAFVVLKILADFPEVESSLRILQQGGFNKELVNHGDKILISVEGENKQVNVYNEENIIYADTNLFSFFTIPLIYGQKDQALKQSNSVVLSESMSLKYFGRQDPTSRTLTLNEEILLTVTGVFEDLPNNTHLKFDMVISNVGFEKQWDLANWMDCYVRLNHSNLKDFESRLAEKSDDYYAENLRDFPWTKVSLFVRPLQDVAFAPENSRSLYQKSKPLLLTLAFIAFSILTMAWVNYINLSVTRTARRLKEVATRKVSGARPIDMVNQFVTEAFVTNILAIALALTLIQLIRTPVYQLFSIQIPAFSTLSISAVVILLSVTCSGILLSGLYPAFVSMAYQPRALFSMNTQTSGKRFIPSLLSVSQLAAAIIFIVMAFTFSAQINHILNMDMGINKEEVLVIDGPTTKPKNYETILGSLKNQVSNIPDVQLASISRAPAIGFGYEVQPKRKGTDIFFGMDLNVVDENFVSLHGLKMIVGRDFINDDRPDVVMISRFAATRLGFNSPEEAIGSWLTLRVRRTELNDWTDVEIIGVFENFRKNSYLASLNTQSGEEGRGEMFMNEKVGFDNELLPETISVRVDADDFTHVINSIQSLYEQQFPGNVFKWSFLDSIVQQQYLSEKTARNQIILFTVLALIIACLGLLGMITNKAVAKTKEIGIRKVLGAQLYQIAQILLSTTTKQIVVAAIIGIPVAYYLTEQYLERYSERVTLQWWHFALPVLILVVIMFSTIASVLWKAAKNNPVEALKYE